MQLLTGGALDLPERQQTLRNTIDWSHGLLNQAERKLFRRLSVFSGGCTLQAAEAVCNTTGDLGIDVFEGLASLVDKSLVLFLPGEGKEACPLGDGSESPRLPSSPPRYRFLETVRAA